MFSVKKAIATFVVILLYSSGLILLSCAKSDNKWLNSNTPEHDPKHYWEEKFERKGLTVKPGSGFQKALGGGDVATGGIGLTRSIDLKTTESFKADYPFTKNDVSSYRRHLSIGG